MKTISIIVPIYNEKIIIQNHLKDLPDDIKIPQGAQAGFWRDGFGNQHIWLGIGIMPWKTIPHECVHIANRILAERNVIYYPMQDEALAYLVGFLSDKVSEAFFELYDSGKSEKPTNLGEDK